MQELVVIMNLLGKKVLKAQGSSGDSCEATSLHNNPQTTF